MKINFCGTIFGTDGYSNHCRQLVNALYEINPDIKLEVPLPPDWIRFANDAELNMITKEPRKADVTISVSQPQFWRLHMSDCEKFVGFLVWEGDKIPKYWVEYLCDRKVNQIWVPSQHTKDAIIRTFFIEQHTNESGYPEQLSKDEQEFVNNIKIVPHGVNTNIFKPQPTKKDKFVFLCNKGWRGTLWDRGGVQYVIKAFCEEFKKDEPVELLLKLNPSYINPQLIEQYLKGLNLPKNKPTIKINCDNIPYNRLSEFYNQVDVYVCAQRADAFNIPGIEAMACGLPTIQTGFGGQQDYMNDKNSWSIDYTLVDVENDIQYESVSWAIPNIEYLKNLMREAFEHQNEVKEKGKRALEDSKNFTWRISAKKALKFLNEI